MDHASEYEYEYVQDYGDTPTSLKLSGHISISEHDHRLLKIWQEAFACKL